jgi:hypothetical protein
MSDGAVDPTKVAALFALKETPPAVAVMSVLRW